MVVKSEELDSRNALHILVLCTHTPGLTANLFSRQSEWHRTVAV